jgi:hypothetical protein
MRRRNSRNTDLTLSVGQETVTPVYITTRKAKSIKLLKKHDISDKVKFAANIETTDIGFTVKAD